MKKVNPQDDAEDQRERRRSNRRITSRNYRNRVKQQLENRPVMHVLKLKFLVGKVLDSMTMKGITMRMKNFEHEIRKHPEYDLLEQEIKD